MFDTANGMYGIDPQAAPALAGPGTVAGVPAPVANFRGLRGLHPGHSPTPWVIGLALVLVLLLHPKVGGSVGLRGSVG